VNISTKQAVIVGFWGAAGAAAFWGLLYLTGAGLTLIGTGTAKRPPSAAQKSPCGCGCGG
jgi:hypothetical protein